MVSRPMSLRSIWAEFTRKPAFSKKTTSGVGDGRERIAKNRRSGIASRAMERELWYIRGVDREPT